MIKSTGLLFTALVFSASFLFFTSASTEKKSNSQSIAELSNKLTQMRAELDEMQSTECGEEVFIDPTIGQIAMFAGNFAPRGWAFCDGQLLPISQYQALFSVIGTIYGGDGRSTFALPDLRGRVAVHAGNGPGLSDIRLGAKFGQERMNIVPQTAAAAPATGADKVLLVSGILPEVNNMQPSLAVNYIIALQGVFPSRN